MIILYDRAFWREEGYSGEILSDEGPAALFYDATTSDGKQPALVWLVCVYQMRSLSKSTISNRLVS